MFKFLALVALAAVASAATLPRSLPRSYPWSPSGRIVGGEDTTIEEVPYQISLQLNGRHQCGGSIISKYYVVTAAHCVGGRLSSFSVIAGTNSKISGGSNHSVAAIVVHERYGENLYGIPINDVAVIRVNEPFEFDETRQPIELFDDNEETPVGAVSIITGWGKTVQSGASPVILQTVSVPIISKRECSRAYSIIGGIPAGQICAAYPEGGKDACQGDSGGPLAVGGRLAGIVSWGNGCAIAGNPGVYTEVAAVRDFIRDNSGV